jgi:predicted molibdopterin-dependent oxidoreductase YjgC
MLAELERRPAGASGLAADASIDVLAEAARIIGGGERVSILYPRARGADPGFLAAATNLGLIVEAFGREGAGIFPLVDETNQQGALDMGVAPNVTFPSDQPASPTAGEAGLTGAEMLVAAADGRLRAMYIAGRDVSSVPGYDSALGALEFLVVQETTMTETARLADVVLPGMTFAEKDGTYTNLERRVQRLRPCLEPPGEARPDWRIFRDIVNALGGLLVHTQAEDVLVEIAATVPTYAGVTLGRVGFKGVQWPYPAANGGGARFLYGDPAQRFALLPMAAR